MTILNEFIETQYSEIMLMSKKICKSHHEHEEVGHFSIEKFMLHERAEELIQSNRAMAFLSGIIHRSFHSSTSQYHTESRQKGRVHGFNSNAHLEARDIEYDHETDDVIGHIQVILEEMVAERKDGTMWMNATLFQKWVENPNYSKLSEETKIPRTTISTHVNQAREYIQKELKKRGINYEL